MVDHAFSLVPVKTETPELQCIIAAIDSFFEKQIIAVHLVNPRQHKTTYQCAVNILVQDSWKCFGHARQRLNRIFYHVILECGNILISELTHISRSELAVLVLASKA